MATSSGPGFDYNLFIDTLLAPADVSHRNHHERGWEPRGDGPTNQVVEYAYKNEYKKDKYDLHFRSWYIEQSVAMPGQGLVVSTKIDYERNTGDDHLLLLCCFDAQGQLSSAQVGVQFHGADKDNFAVKPVRASQSPDVAQALYDDMTTRQQDVDYGGKTDNAGRHAFAYIAKLHVEAMTAAVSAPR